MIMKRILYYIWILPLMLSGCEKDLMDYEGLEGVTHSCTVSCIAWVSGNKIFFF